MMIITASIKCALLYVDRRTAHFFFLLFLFMLFAI